MSVVEVDPARVVRGLTPHMRRLLWTVAQHRYGWANVTPSRGGRATADGLVRRGLVEWGPHGRDDHAPTIAATDFGQRAIKATWPVSPYALGTYEKQPGGWDPVGGKTER